MVALNTLSDESIILASNQASQQFGGPCSSEQTASKGAHELAARYSLAHLAVSKTYDIGAVPFNQQQTERSI